MTPSWESLGVKVGMLDGNTLGNLVGEFGGDTLGNSLGEFDGNTLGITQSSNSGGPSNGVSSYTTSKSCASKALLMVESSSSYSNPETDVGEESVPAVDEELDEVDPTSSASANASCTSNRTKLGALDGTELGTPDGTKLGALDGTKLGAVEGTKLGTVEGDTDGDAPESRIQPIVSILGRFGSQG